MPDSGEFPVLPDDFPGVVRLFPLPNLVLFPHMMQPLHIFEPRYKDLLEDALAHDKLITMALLAPGWQPTYEERPQIEPVVCIGRVVSHAQLENGTYNLLLLGAARARVTRELSAGRTFRTAEVELLEDVYPTLDAPERPGLQRKLLDKFRELTPQDSPMQEQFEQLLSQQIPLGTLTDMAAFTLGFPIPFKQELLAERNVDRRAELLIKRLEEQASGEEPGRRKFPPEFSEN